jgi:hypothetical protein
MEKLKENENGLEIPNHEEIGTEQEEETTEEFNFGDDEEIESDDSFDQDVNDVDNTQEDSLSANAEETQNVGNGFSRVLSFEDFSNREED